MADFYSQMAAVAAQLLAPTSQNGLGQGSIVLSHATAGTPGANPWDPVEPTMTTETLSGAVKGVDQKLVGTEVGGQVILASDRQVIAAVPSIPYAAGDSLSIDGKPVHILSVENVPAAGVAAAVRFLVRG